MERLRADILSTKLVPGQKLHIAGLAKQFSVSLAAVREALSRLVADGLVQASDQRGFRVSPVSPADLADVTQTRIDIEGLALRRSIERGDQAWLASVEKAFASLNAVPYRHPDEPGSHYEVGSFATASSTAPWSMPAVRHGYWAFATCCTSRASATGGCRSAAKPA